MESGLFNISSATTTTLIDDGRVLNRNWTYSGMSIPDHIAEEVQQNISNHRKIETRFKVLKSILNGMSIEDLRRFNPLDYGHWEDIS